ncbi:hypothetical protein LEP1GSC120_0600 [Leptospira santarosai str. 200702252]|nr:hypothetical protein LEP1GSC120_0600 [Leptospira santarosai str. 200702252]
MKSPFCDDHQPKSLKVFKGKNFRLSKLERDGVFRKENLLDRMYFFERILYLLEPLPV